MNSKDLKAGGREWPPTRAADAVAHERRPYQKPRLARHGRLSELTLGPSYGSQESGAASYLKA